VPPNDSQKTFALVLAYTITLVWAVSFIADIVLGDAWEPSPYVHLALMGAAGWAFGPAVMDRMKGDEKK
jgi:hypothetical protein